MYAFARVAPPDKPVIVVLNKSDRAVDLQVPVGRLYPDGTLLTDELSPSYQVLSAGGKLGVSVGARSGLIFVGTS